jgi:hypothetical protein
MRLIIVLLIFLTLSTIIANIRGYAQVENICSEKEAITAQKEAKNIKDWDTLYDSFKRFAACDDGAIAEEYSDSISYLLVHEWTSLDVLGKFTSTDKNFEQFVLRHIDMTIPVDTLETIGENARLRCASKLLQLCGSIESRVANIRSGIGSGANHVK